MGLKQRVLLHDPCARLSSFALVERPCSDRNVDIVHARRAWPARRSHRNMMSRQRWSLEREFGTPVTVSRIRRDSSKLETQALFCTRLRNRTHCKQSLIPSKDGRLEDIGDNAVTIADSGGRQDNGNAVCRDWRPEDQRYSCPRGQSNGQCADFLGKAPSGRSYCIVGKSRCQEHPYSNRRPCFCQVDEPSYGALLFRCGGCTISRDFSRCLVSGTMSMAGPGKLRGLVFCRANDIERGSASRVPKWREINDLDLTETIIVACTKLCNLCPRKAVSSYTFLSGHDPSDHGAAPCAIPLPHHFSSELRISTCSACFGTDQDFNPLFSRDMQANEHRDLRTLCTQP